VTFLHVHEEGGADDLRSSLSRTPRDVTLVYGNPDWHGTVMASGLFALEWQVSGRDISQYSVYTHQAFATAVRGSDPPAPTSGRRPQAALLSYSSCAAFSSGSGTPGVLRAVWLHGPYSVTPPDALER